MKILASSLAHILLLFSCSVMSDSFNPMYARAHQAPCPWDFPGKNTGVGCHFNKYCLNEEMIQMYTPPPKPTLSNSCINGLPLKAGLAIAQTDVLTSIFPRSIFRN